MPMTQMLLNSPKPSGGTYFLLDISANNGAARVFIIEFKIMVGATEYPVSGMTSNSAPVPYVSSADTVVNTDFAYKAFTKIELIGDRWQAANPYGQLKLYIGATAILPTSIKIRSYGTFAPKDFTFKMNTVDDFSTGFTTLTTVTNSTGWTASGNGQERLFLF